MENVVKNQASLPWEEIPREEAAEFARGYLAEPVWLPTLDPEPPPRPGDAINRRPREWRCPDCGIVHVGFKAEVCRNENCPGKGE